MKRTLPAVLFLTALLLLPLLLLDSSLVASRVGEFVAARSGIELGFRSGSLLRGFEVDRVRWIGEDLRVELRDVVVEPRWDWDCLVRSTLCLEQVRVASIELVDSRAAAAATAFPPAPVRLPLGLVADRLQIEQLSIDARGRVETFAALKAAASLDEGGLRLADLSLEHHLGSLAGEFSLQMEGRWPLRAALDADLTPPAALAELPRQWRLWLDGDLGAAALRAASSTQPVLELAVQMQRDGTAATDGISVTARGLAALPSVRALQPWVQLAAPVTLRLASASDIPQLQVETALAGYTPVPAVFTAALSFREDQWVLDEAALRDDEGGEHLRAAGPLGSPASWQPRLMLQGTALQLPPETDMNVQQLTLSAELAITVPDAGNSWRLDDLRATALVAGNELSVQGDLRVARQQPLLPLGSATGTVDGTTWSYSRDEVAAVLKLPDGLQRERWALEHLRVSVTPGAVTSVQLSAGGDLEGELALRLSEQPGGLRWQLSPFEARALGLPIAVEETVVGAWSAETRQLSLEPACLSVSTSRVCSDAAQLGAAGHLTLRAEVRETFSRALADDPWTLQLGGAGRLALDWEGGAFTAAEVELQLPEVSFDPFDAAGTAPPLRLDDVSLRARATPSTQSATLLVTSQQHGRIDARLRRDHEALEGTARLQALSLAALNDLLPEFDIAAGQLDGQLEVSGSTAAPKLDGVLQLQGLAAALPNQSVALRDGSLSVQGTQDAFTVLGSGELGDGPLRISGECCGSGALELRLEGERNQLHLPAGIDVLASSDLDVSLDAARARVRGTVHVHEGRLEHAGPLGEGVPVSRDIVRVDRDRRRARRFVLDADVRALIDPGFTLRSRELEATLGGDLRALVEAGQPPQLFGELQVLGGAFRAYGQGLRLDRGSVGFVGDPYNPDVSLAAVRDLRREQLQVGVRVTGTLDAPSLELFSDPQRSERETLSYLLRGRPPDAGAAADGTAMALALGATAINQSGLLEGLNSLPGLSQVSLGAEGSDDDTAATISAYVGDRLFLSYGVGIYEPVNALTARLYLRSRLWFEVVSRLERSFDLYYRFDRN